MSSGHIISQSRYSVLYGETCKKKNLTYKLPCFASPLGAHRALIILCVADNLILLETHLPRFKIHGLRVVEECLSFFFLVLFYALTNDDATIITIFGDLHLFADNMRIVQALRRSIKGDKDKPAMAAFGHKTALSITPPKKVSVQNSCHHTICY